MSAQTKIFQTANPPTTPNETDLMVAQAILDLETNIPDLTTKLRPLQISAACEVRSRVDARTKAKAGELIFIPSDLNISIKAYSLPSCLQTDPGTGNEILRSPCRLNHWPGPNDA
ncbi:hypothetical protein PTTG_26451 [Puccinia triticina 1-1 BBBD Race 1]|uniref:Uncharacterized protein n=1 Tax=Puccinia triticina (isolate 1-1 / race 1 (BBBD)) TaxID=630390 RepID=A0A180GU29_PUCT1|nr:hypothetical protein PTTG_26451 [Puccinia triticina 1-1 BBBD Race 1]